MSDRRIPPHDMAAEEAVLCAMLIDPSAVPVARSLVSTKDFYSPSHQVIFDAIVSCWMAGSAFDIVVVQDQLRRSGTEEMAGGAASLARILDRGAMASAVDRYAEVVGRLAYVRRLLEISLQAAEQCWDTGADPEKVVDQMREGLATSASTSLALPPDATSLDEWLQEEHSARPWVIPGLFREGWRIVVVGEEGTGKSVCTRQIAIAAAQGIHPFWQMERYTPINTLLIDLENPDEAIEETGRRIQRAARLAVGEERYREHGCWIWTRPAGIDLRRRSNRSELDAVIAHVRPKLVCLGPLYRSFTRRGREDHEEVAEQVQGVLDDLRARHGFALLIEHHAPKGQGGKRVLEPFGSSLWKRWPDLGLTLTKDSEVFGALKVGRYRGDRVTARWPDRLDRGQQWPWAGYYESGIHKPDEPTF